MDLNGPPEIVEIKKMTAKINLKIKLKQNKLES